MCVFNMSALSTSFYPPSNRRRCVKGRPSYTEPSDNFVSSAAVNNDHSSDSFNQADYSSLDPLEPDDVDEEPITIDLSAFLNENPLLAQSAFECSSENNVASTESSSQFRVTDCEVKTPQINSTELPKTDFSDSPSTVNINGSANETVMNENSVPSVFLPNAILASDTRDSIKENCLNLPKSFPSINVINNEPAKDITLNGKRSPIKKFSKAKPLGLSNPLKKYKNLKTKDINKTNVKVFGKYPVVKCEKLDIENLVKNNKIKVSNWPLHHTNKSPKNNRNLLNKNGLANKKLTLSKPSSKPKLLRKPMSFSKYLINANKESAADKVSNILVDSYDATTKSVVIQNDCWRPEITSTPIPTIFTSPIKTAQFVQKTVLSNVIKHESIGDSVSQLVNFNPVPPGHNLHIGKKPPFITNVNKVKILPKTYPFIAPKPVPHSQEITSVSPNLSKTVFQTLLEPVSNEYTVIEPYIDDPTSPVKPKPILTVPVEVIPSPERQGIELHSSTSHKNENSGDAVKPLKTVKSVFLNGAIKQISTPTRLKKEISVMKKDNTAKWKLDNESVFNTPSTMSIMPTEEKNDLSEECVSDLKVDSPDECFSSLQAKNAVVDAMQSVFSSFQKVKKPKPRLAKKEPHNSHIQLTSDASKVGGFYSSALNGLLFDCTETDFDDSFNTDEDNVQSSITSTSHDSLTSPFKTPSRETDKINESVESIYTPTGSKRERKRKKISLDSPSTSDTLSASECENECDNRRKENSPRRKLRNNTSLSDVSENTEFSSVCDIFNKSGKSDTPGNDLAIPPESISYPENNKNFNIKHTDSSLSFHNLEKSVTVKLDEEIKKDKQSDSPNSIHNEMSTSNIEDSLLNKKINSASNLVKSETCTRTLRERKCSSTEVDKLSDNSVKQSPHRNAQDKNSKLIKGSINSKLKIQMKTPPRSTAKVKIKRKSCKPDDIIREINTITGGQLSLKKGLKKHKKGSDSDKDIKNSDLSSNKEDSESNSSVSFQWSRHSRAFSKKKKTLKVHFKRSKKKNAASCLPMQLNSLTDVIENANSASSLPENNVSLHSSFRKGKAENMGTPCKEENSSHNDTSISEHSVESVETDEKNTDGEHLLSNACEDSMVNSSETSLIQDNASVINSDLNSTVSDSSLCIENQKINCDIQESSEESEFVDNHNKLDSNKENSILSESNEILNMCESDLECSNFISETLSGESSNIVISKNNLEKIPCSTSCSSNLEENTVTVLSELDEKSSDISHPQGHLHETDSLALEDNSVTPSLTSDNNCEIDNMLTEASNFEMTSDVLNQEDSFDNNTSVIDEIENVVLKAVEVTSDEIEENFAHKVQESNALEERGNIAELDEKTLDVSENITELDEKSLDASENIAHQADEIATNVVDEYSAPEAVGNDTNENAPGTDANEVVAVEVDKTSEKETNESVVPEVGEDANDVPAEYEKSFHEDSENVTYETCENDVLETDKNEIHLKLPSSTCVPEPNGNDTLETVIDDSKASKCLESTENTDVSKSADDKSRETDSEILGNTVTDNDIDVSDLDNSLSIKGGITVKQSFVDSSDNMLNPVTPERNNEVFKPNDVTPKKCPKIKISFIKNPSEGSPDSLKNWYVSESKPSEDLPTQTEVPETQISKSVECNNENIKDAPDSQHEMDLNDSTSVKGDGSEFTVTAAAVDNSDEVGTDNFDTSLDKSISSLKELPGEEVEEQVVVKEEPMDFEEENEGLVSDNLNTTCGEHEIKPEPVVEISKKRSRGRPRSSNGSNKSSSTRLNKSFASVSQEPSNIVTPKSRGRKKKIFSPVTPVSNTSTPGRKKNYVPELVVVPFSMGWMREHVIRATETKDHRRPSDIYYFAPDGTKLRSMPEISTYLSKHKEIKLSMENFTFAKELIYREPFEIERDARHPAKKHSIPTPIKKNASSKTPSSAGKKAKVKHESTKQISVPVTLSVKEEPSDTLPDNTSPSVETKVKKASKRKNSLSKETAATVHEESESSNCDSENSSRVSRPSRKIVKKVPFDNSSENKLPRKQKLVVQQNSGVSNIKIVSVKSVTKENERLDDKPTAVSDSQPVNEKSEPSVNKLTPTVSGNIPDMFLPKRTSEKTSLIQKRLKVKLAPKKSDNVLHKPCTKFCNFAYARKPSVKCCICLCLFHPECIPFKPTGQTKYACVPCVKTQMDNDSDPLPETPYRADFDTQLFSPLISLHITSDPNFNAVFNKFYSPVDQSFVKSCEEFNSDNFYQSANHNNANTVQQFAPSVSRCTRYIVEKSSLDSFLHHPDKVLNNIWFPTSVGGTSGGQTGHQTGIGVPNLRTSTNYPRPCLENPLPPYFNFYSYPPNVTTVNNINALGTFRNVMVQNSNYVSATKPVSNVTNKNLPDVGNIVNSSKTLASNQIVGDRSLQNMCNLVHSNSPVLQTLLQTSDNASCDEKTYSKKSKLKDSIALKDCSSVIPVSAAITLATNSSGTLGKNRNMTSQNTSYPKYIVFPLDSLSNQNVPDSSSRNLLKNSNKITLTNSLAALKTLTHSINAPESSDNFIISASNAVLQNSGVVHNMPSKEVATQANQNCESNDSSSFNTVVCNILPKAFENNDESNKRKSDSFDSVYSDNNPQDPKKFKGHHSAQTSNSTQSTQHSPVKGSIKENECTDHQSSFWDINKFSQVYECLNLIFKFLNVSDLLRACLVCRSWKHLATQKFLWENVHFSGLAITDWNKCCRALQKYGTKFIDFRGIIDQDSTKAWGAFSKNIKRLTEVEEFIFEKVPPFIIHSITDCSSQVKKLTCYCLTSVFTEPEIWSTPCEFELATLRYLGCLQLLKISSMGGVILDDKSHSLMPYLPNLTHLVLTGFKFHSYMNLECLSQQQQLISLELGDCTDIEPQIYGLIAKLTNLRNLCLQNGGIVNDRKLPEAVLKMKRLENLELMNFQVSGHLGNVLKKMTELTHFSIWPDITHQAALINFNSFHAVTSCANLNNICWGILTEDDTVPNILEMKDPNKKETDKLTFEDLFQTLVKHFPGKNVEVKCLPRSIWSEYCSSREFM